MQWLINLFSKKEKVVHIPNSVFDFHPIGAETVNGIAYTCYEPRANIMHEGSDTAFFDEVFSLFQKENSEIKTFSESEIEILLSEPILRSLMVSRSLGGHIIFPFSEGGDIEIKIVDFDTSLHRRGIYPRKELEVRAAPSSFVTYLVVKN
jgi:hypothetical protein